MTTTAVPLDEFARRISQQQAELEALRQEYQARQAQLTDLNSRKQELQEQLAQVENEIRTVTLGKIPRPPSVAPAAPTAKKPVSGSQVKPTPTGSLPQVLKILVSEAKRPMTVKELTEQLLRRKFPTTSKDLATIVRTRVGELVKKGIFRRSKDGAGVVAAQRPRTVQRPSPRPRRGSLASPQARRNLRPPLQRSRIKSNHRSGWFSPSCWPKASDRSVAGNWRNRPERPATGVPAWILQRSC